jgi:hypothetical protein
MFGMTFDYTDFSPLISADESREELSREFRE